MERWAGPTRGARPRYLDGTRRSYAHVLVTGHSNCTQCRMWVSVRATLLVVPGRKPHLVTMKAQVTPDVKQAIDAMCAREGVTISSVAQAFGEFLISFGGEIPFRVDEPERPLLIRAREIGAERRARSDP